MQNFYNVSLVGTGGVANIECVRSSLYIILQNNTKLTIRNINITNFGFDKSPSLSKALIYVLFTWISAKMLL